MSGSHFIMFTPDTLERLKVAVDKAVSQDMQQFEFEGQQLLVAYAKYLIEYLDGVLEKPPGKDVDTDT